MYKDPNPTRIDYLRYDVMEKINDLVRCVLRFARENPNSDIEAYLREVTEKIEDVCEGRVGPHEYVLTEMYLRSLAAFVRSKPTEKDTNEIYALSITNRIIDIVQGDNIMSKSTLSAMIFRRVKEAVTWAAVSGGGGSDERITEVVEDCVGRIITDAFGGKTPAEIQTEGLVDAFYEMDPETEDVLSNGTLIVDGMKVLIESPSNRTIVHDQLSDAGLYEARRDNSWCKVENSAIEGAYVAFVGVYEDGVKRKRMVLKSEAWVVKKDSIPRVDGIYSIAQDEVVVLGSTKNVVDSLRSVRPSNWSKYMAFAGNEEYESVNDYLFREEAFGLGGEDFANSSVLYDAEGRYIYCAKSEAVMRRYIERNIEPALYDEYQVEEGDAEDGEARPLVDYLGVNDQFVVWDEEKTELFKGTRDEVRKWADSPTGKNKRYIGCGVSREGQLGETSLRDFMRGVEE